MSEEAFYIRDYAPEDYAAARTLWVEAGMNPFTEPMLARVHAMGGARCSWPSRRMARS